MSIRIIPQDELGSSEKRTAEAIPPLLFPRLKNLYNRRAERLRELAANNPLGDYLRFAALIVVIMVHIYAALWVKGTITAMVEGWVTKTWAKKHHPRWYREVREKQDKRQS